MAWYAKLWSSVTESSLWSESKDVRLLFVSMLARADSMGFVDASIPGLARLANLTMEETQAALEVLQAPDQYSKNADNEGRRVAVVPGGFMVLNYEEHRNRRDDEKRKEYMRDYMRDYRAGKRKHRLAAVNSGKPRLAQGEAEAEALEQLSTVVPSGSPESTPVQPDSIKPPATGSGYLFPSTTGPWELSARKLAEYEVTYTKVDIPDELAKARQWLKDNPNRRKTKNGMSAFLTRWLGKADDKRVSTNLAPTGTNGASPGSGGERKSFWELEEEAKYKAFVELREARRKAKETSNGPATA